MKMCIVVCVYGKKYQTFIPLYVYSIYKAYPEYAIRIITDKLDDKWTQDWIKKLPNSIDFKVIASAKLDGLEEKFYKHLEIKKSMRWLYIDKEFFEFDAVYIGDVDFIICPEKIGILEAHLKHCEVLGLPYSNIVRNRITNRSTKEIIKNIRDWGGKAAFHNLYSCPNEILRLSGLHFYITKPYLTAVRPIIPELIKELRDILIGTHPTLNLVSMSTNEWILYRLVELAGLEPAEKVEDIMPDDEFNEYLSNPEVRAYRPYHGIHLGGEWDNPIKDRKRFLLWNINLEYFQYFQQWYAEDLFLQNLLKDKNVFANLVVDEMIDFYNRMKVENFELKEDLDEKS